MPDLDRAHRLQMFIHYAAECNQRAYASLDERFPDPEAVFMAAKTRDAAAFSFLSDFVQKRLFEAADERFLDRYADWLIRHEIGVAVPGDEAYPALLAEIHDPPRLLFYKGRLKRDMALPLAIVGTRKATKYGRDIARLFAFELARRGATVVSGMAAGIDSYAALGALDCEASEYPTVAVLGCGVDVVYPAGNDALYRQIIERGAVISEFLPGAKPLSEHFPVRNRIISGMSRGVLVVEAGERSGASITANCALEQGRDVFAVPGRITDLLSVGTNRLIQQGAAKPVFCAEDILAEYGSSAAADGPAKPVYAADSAQLLPEEKAVVERLRQGESSFDELCQALAFEAGRLNSCLTGLEFSGIIKQLPGRMYALTIGGAAR